MTSSPGRDGPTSPEVLPNLFVVGAMRSGSTALYGWLAGHPEVFMSPIKEPNYFSRDDGPPWMAGPSGGELRAYLDGPRPFRHAARVRRWGDYLRLFEGAEGFEVKGEASPAYLYSPTAPQAIDAACPGTRAVAVLRSPIDRAVSHHRMDVGIGATAGSLEDEIISSGEIDPSHPYLDGSLYAERVERYMGVFGGRFRAYLFEDLEETPDAVLADLSAFLDIDPGGFTSPELRQNPSPRPGIRPVHAALRFLYRSGVMGPIAERVPGRVFDVARRWYYGGGPGISPATEAALGEVFRGDVRRLEGLIGRDLSAWLGG